MTSAAVLDLSKRLHELESRAKLLRNDVASLEATQRNLAISESTNNRALEIRRQVTEGEEAKEASSKRRTAHRTPAAAQQLPLPQDFIDELTHKAGDVQSIIDKHRSLTKEKEDLMAILGRVENEANAAEQRYYSVAELAGVDADGHSELSAALRRKNAFISTRNELVAMYREREVMRRAMNEQSKQFTKLATTAEDTANAEEQKAEAIAVLAEKSAKLEKLTKERKQLERLVHAKDDILDKKPKGPSKEDIIRSANYDRRVALYELEKEGEQLKMNDAAVRTRAMQIAKAEKRIEMIGDAVAGDGLNDEERVDAELMEELINETAALYNLHTEACLRMDSLDAQLEKITYKINAITQVIKSTDRERQRIVSEHERYLSKLQQEYNQEQTANAQGISRAETEVECLRSGPAKPNRRSRKEGAWF